MGEAFGRAFFVDHLRYASYAVTAHEKTAEGTILRTTKGEPSSRGVPPMLKHCLGYSQTGVLFAKENRYAFRTYSTHFPKLVDIEGEVALTEDPPNRHAGTLRRVTLRASVNVFGGSLVEPAMLARVRKSFDQSAAFLNLWLLRHPHA